MQRREIERQFDAIVDFSGVERFLETPVKRYSSGMYVRLAFAVAADLTIGWLEPVVDNLAHAGGFVTGVVLAIVLVRRRILTFTLLVVGTSLLLVAFHFIGERLDVRSGVGFWRIASLTSRRIAEESGAVGTAEWRMIRWKRALDEIST